MSAGFTKGPWHADFLQPPTIVDASGQEVVDMPLWQPAFQDERDANAHLIAAAPELYEALEAFNFKEDGIVSGTADTLTLRVPIKALRDAAAALAKARGEAVSNG